VLGFERHRLRIDNVAIEQVELDELLRRSDIVSLHLPLTEETRGVIGREQLARASPTYWFRDHRSHVSQGGHRSAAPGGFPGRGAAL